MFSDLMLALFLGPTLRFVAYSMEVTKSWAEPGNEANLMISNTVCMESSSIYTLAHCYLLGLQFSGLSVCVLLLLARGPGLQAITGEPERASQMAHQGKTSCLLAYCE